MGLVIAAARAYQLVVLVRAVFTWLPSRHRDNEVYRFLRAITDPVLEPIRKVLPRMGGFDVSPLVVIFGLELVVAMLLRL